jgi:hypothetical protein
MYPLANMTPYWHVLHAHVGDQLRACAAIGIPLANFSTEAIEKKNHEHSSWFFRHTTMNGGIGVPPLLTLMRKENRMLFPASVGVTSILKKKKVINFATKKNCSKRK